MNLEELFIQNKVLLISGRYITVTSIEPILQRLNIDNQLSVIGSSVQGKPIYKFLIGSGKLKIYLWSQMHGNESTTTKGLLDFLNLLHNGSELAKKMLETFTFCCIPMLNPDGANLYTRENANKVDLNRDAQDLTQVESKILRETFDSFNPDYCYNLHDQRTIFGVDESGKPATMSFLAPSYNEEREVNDSRLKAINLIVSINDSLQKLIPGQVGRFDDSFNINCIGDTFQYLGTPTLLFEAGHFQGDYEREETRKYVFVALISSFIALSENDIVVNGIDKYLNIPQNKVVFYDLIYKKVRINYDGIEKITNFALQYKEELFENNITFNAYLVAMGELHGFFGHYVYEAKESLYSDDVDDFPKLNQKANFYLNKSIKIVNGLIKK
jgi:hypothetical protein